jgi:cytochrome bd-type quinol oxidase subunit 2
MRRVPRHLVLPVIALYTITIYWLFRGKLIKP